MKATPLCCIWMFVLVAINEAIPRKMASNVEENKQEVSRELLMSVGDELNDEWLSVGRHLDLSEADINNITSDHHRNLAEAKLQMLLKWKKRNGTLATRKALADALIKARRHDLVQGLLTGEDVQEAPQRKRQKKQCVKCRKRKRRRPWVEKSHEEDSANRTGTGQDQPCSSRSTTKIGNSYEKFLVMLAELLTLPIVLELATIFHFPKTRYKELQRAAYPGQLLVKNMQNSGLISIGDISHLTNALEELNYDGVKNNVVSLFKIHMNAAVLGFRLSNKKDIFISELRATYQDLYDAVQPIPYIKERLYCVDRVFVEGGIEYLVAKDRIGGLGTWEKLSSYHNVLDGDKVKSARRIIEGEPGYGKSTLTLQLSYDWCNKIQQSYLKDTDVLILLRLRQLGGVTSVYRAIKKFLLPKDSKLTESDVSDIIGDCSSVLVILDGYDEYPDQDSDTDSDVISIIKRKMFQQCEVILTTRSSYLPNEYPALTKRLKLTGFDDNARDEYIRKAVVGDDVEAANKIKQRLKENPVLSDLCQVPLMFVMFAHMSHESDQFQKINSVTSFFRYMISCFHSHMKNKMKDENVKKYDLFETDHRELNKLAFEGLSGKDQHIVWSKKEMCERLGQDFYDQYVRIGILVEEEVLDICDDPSSIISEHIQYKTEVRFYHKLFCEWYAAHHLAEYASRDNVNFNPRTNDHYLSNVDPFDLQYVYRFTCGLSPVAAGKIIGYLKTRMDASKFAILCILEKSGKVKDVLQVVKDLCSGTVEIKAEDSLLLQRSTLQLLEIALANKISISHVYLRNCYSTVYLSGGYHLQLKSNLYIPVLTTLNELTIYTYGEGKEIRAEEFTDILQYSSKCLALEKLDLRFCLLPQSVQAESVSILRSRSVKVTWITLWGIYQLNLQSCLWERIDYDDQVIGVMTDDDYQSEVRWFRKEYGKE